MFRRNPTQNGDSARAKACDFTNFADDEREKAKKYLFDDESEVHYHLAKVGRASSMVYLAQKLFQEYPTTDESAMEEAFKWLLRAAKKGNETAIDLIRQKRRFCSPKWEPFLEDAIRMTSDQKEKSILYSKRVACRFSVTYENVNEEAVSAQVMRILNGGTPSCETVFVRCFPHVFGDLFALGVTLVLGGFIGHIYLSSFDHLLSAKLARMMDAFFAFLCSVLLIVSIRTYSELFSSNIYAGMMELDAKYRDFHVPFRLRLFWLKSTLHVYSLLCVTAMVVLSILSFGRVPLTVFSCITYLIAVLDLIQHLHWWINSSRFPDHYVGRYPLILKLITVACMFAMFSFTKADLQDTIITMSMTLLGCSLMFLYSECSVFSFSFLTSECSLILQGLSFVKTLMFLVNRMLFFRIPRRIKTILIVYITIVVFQSLPSGLVFRPRETTANEVYDLCKTTLTTADMVACSRLEGRRLVADAYIESTSLVSRSNLQEAAGLENATLDDGFVKLKVDSFEKIKVEVKLSSSSFKATTIMDDDALAVVRLLKGGQYMTIDGVIETARAGPQIRLIIHSVVYDGQSLEVKRFGIAVRQYWRHVHSVLDEWRNRIWHITNSESKRDEL